ncbi:MAG: DUF362 domain-containing protein [Clostridia bacterium]|nr:DUF362 domain-containing protein [Clostridia bacterium]
MKRKINFNDKVYLYSCKTYRQQEVTTVLNTLLDKICADNNFTDFQGKKVVLKPNLLAKRAPDMGVTTQPSFVIAASEYFSQKGAEVIIADSPGGVYHPTLLKSLYKVCRMDEAPLAQLNFNVESETVKLEDKEFSIIKPLVEADVIVNLARMKTHTLCDMTAAVKNLFGSIPGLTKAEYHAKYPNKKVFSEMLVDLCLANAPQINIIDGVVGMEGEGPANGTPIKTGVIIGSANPFAADCLCAELMGFNEDEVDTVRISRERGLCPSVKDLKVEGEQVSAHQFKFKRPKGTNSSIGLVKILPGFIKRIFETRVPQPFILKDKCIGCGECARCCPAETIKMVGGKADIKYDKCIKCFCCQELCPQKAVDIKKMKVKTEK